MIRMDKNILHNAEELWMKYEADSMTDAERIAFLEQALDDEEGLEQLVFVENNRVPMPAYLEEEILGHILGETLLEERGHAETVSVSSGRSSWAKIGKHLELLCYSAKITFAAACAIVTLFFMPDADELGRMNECIALQRKSETMARHQAKRENVWEKWQIDRESSKKNAREQYEIAQEKRESNVAAQSTNYVADAFQNLSKIIYDGGFNND